MADIGDDNEDNDSSKPPDSILREPLLPLGGDEDEEHLRQHVVSFRTTSYVSFCDIEREREQGQRQGQGQRHVNFIHNDESNTNHVHHNDDSDSDLNSTSNHSQDPPYFAAASASAAAETTFRRGLGIAFCSLLTQSLWSESLLSIFVVLVWKDRPEYVGFVPAIAGLAQTMASVAATAYSDCDCDCGSTDKRVLLARLASLAGLAAAGLSLYAMAMISGWNWNWIWNRDLPQHSELQSESDSALQLQWRLFLFANGLWGLFWGILEVALLKIVVEVEFEFESAGIAAGLVPIPAHRWVPLGGVLGTLVAIGGFYQMGNDWSIGNCARVLVCGAGSNMMVVVMLWFLGPVETNSSFDFDPDVDTDTNGDGEAWERYNEVEVEDASPLLSEAGEHERECECEGSDDVAVIDFAQEDEEERRENEPMTTAPLLLIHLSDALSSLAGGLSAWYIPVFLVQRADLGPLGLQCLCLMVLGGQHGSPFLASGLEAAMGPCLASMCLQCFYVVLLLLMVACQEWGFPVWTVCGLYGVQRSLMNSTSSLSRALVVAHCVPTVDAEEPPEQRHAWEFEFEFEFEFYSATAETLQKLLWSGACLAGAFVVRESGLVVDLYATAALQFLACLPLAILYLRCRKDPSWLEDTGEDGTAISILRAPGEGRDEEEEENANESSMIRGEAEDDNDYQPMQTGLLASVAPSDSFSISNQATTETAMELQLQLQLQLQLESELELGLELESSSHYYHSVMESSSGSTTDKALSSVLFSNQASATELELEHELEHEHETDQELDDLDDSLSYYSAELEQQLDSLSYCSAYYSVGPNNDVL